MPIVTWSEEFSVNVKEIDTQHQKLLELVNNLHASVEACIDKQVLEGMLIELVEFTRMHFSTEERFMREHGFPDSATHTNEHRLLLEFHEDDVVPKLARAALGQRFVAEGAVTFFWTTIPYRMEWRYGLAAHKVIALDAGHVCQNLYLACEAIGAGTCAVAAYHQELMDQLLRVDGRDEFTIYLAPVGKVGT